MIRHCIDRKSVRPGDDYYKHADRKLRPGGSERFRHIHGSWQRSMLERRRSLQLRIASMTAMRTSPTCESSLAGNLPGSMRTRRNERTSELDRSQQTVKTTILKKIGYVSISLTYPIHLTYWSGRLDLEQRL